VPTFVLNRNYTLRSLTGHTITFVKGAETLVPPAVVAEAVGIGAERIDAKQDALVAEEKDLPPPMQDGEKEDKVMEAIKLMVERNVRGDFTGNGIPNVRSLERLVGFEVPNRLRDIVWDKWVESQRVEQ
jgi:hypothetical protein